MSRLNGRTALVTGGAGGIGAEICRHLAEAGARVAVCDINDAEAEALAATLPGASAGFAIDVTDSSAVARTVEAVNTQLGKVDILVNNAGVDIIEKFVDSTEESWKTLLTVNYLGTLIVSRAVLDC
ncbi:hypothetical protein CRM90_29365 [Mycobacterium sp. ENV421]|uniref:SDR family NAD(P)-dependent oxidoreductase n=1 Tax=Mycobacterium sp. ENV421 TaxID=1213407 RepID=UPI000C9BE895|nr:SDR family NAD(P)-dependent oxidoreductase [Mycobacterium sp. ENV421]PND54189.1 hypothetical protein CRM90_29365 [Mycobacterium sp. ENV421]